MSYSDSLSVALRRGTANDHRTAERTGIVRDMISDSVTRTGYTLYLRNLFEVYAALEACLADSSDLAERFPLSKVYRARAIASDLSQLAGGDWQSSLSVLPSAVDYRHRIKELARRRAGGALAAHAYVRYLGDLSGGQLLARRLALHSGLDEKQLSFYRFEHVEDIEAAKQDFRRALDNCGVSVADTASVVSEAQRAFQYTIALSREVKQSETP